MKGTTCTISFFFFVGTYRRITLAPFDHLEVKFPDALVLYQHEVDFQFDFRKGPEVNSNYGEQAVRMDIQYYGYPDYGVTSEISDDRSVWSTFLLRLSGWPPKANVSNQVLARNFAFNLLFGRFSPSLHPVGLLV